MTHFSKEVKMDECGLSYGVVSIIGAQSSGKSTLLNHLFGTNFKEMDAYEGRLQTTKGIWLARCVGIVPCTLVMDVEGIDGAERGQDDTIFEKQSALFVLAVSDIVLINMWSHEIGRVQAANKPLLKTVFQEMMRLRTSRKITLMFILRDKTDTPQEKLERQLRDDIEMLWITVPKPQHYAQMVLEEFFNVEIVTLAHFKYEREEFYRQVTSLRQKILKHIAPGGLAQVAFVPGSEFSCTAETFWTEIKENKNLDIPTQQVMLATVRCEAIAEKILCSFTKDVKWCVLLENAKSCAIPGFGKQLTSILQGYLSEYDEETEYFDQGVRYTKRRSLTDELIRLVQPAVCCVLRILHSEVIVKFKKAFDKAVSEGVFPNGADNCISHFIGSFDKRCADAMVEGADWDITEIRGNFLAEVKVYIQTKLKANLNQALKRPVETALGSANETTWPSIKTLFLRETQSATSLSFLQHEKKILQEIVSHARSLIHSMAEKEAKEVLPRMKGRFDKLFTSGITSGGWEGTEGIKNIAKEARSTSLKLLPIMIAVRLEDYKDDVENILSSCYLADDGNIGGISTTDTWNGIPSSETLITPTECQSLLKSFWQETEENSNAVLTTYIRNETSQRLPRERNRGRFHCW